MRRLFLLLVLLAFVGWFSVAVEPVRAMCTARASGLQDGTSPHWGCVDNQCVEIYECGIDDCSACPGCNPDDEYQCLINGGTWDPGSCTCTPRTCNPWDEQECVVLWGTWDPYTCTCWNPCNPQPPVEVGHDSWDEFWGCSACFEALINHVDTTYYNEYCEDGRIWSSYSIGNGYITNEFSWDCMYMCWEW